MHFVHFVSPTHLEGGGYSFGTSLLDATRFYTQVLESYHLIIGID